MEKEKTGAIVVCLQYKPRGDKKLSRFRERKRKHFYKDLKKNNVLALKKNKQQLLVTQNLCKVTTDTMQSIWSRDFTMNTFCSCLRCFYLRYKFSLAVFMVE